MVPNPGFTGSAGRVITINFKAVSQGDAPIRFSSGSVLANDGNGTNILRNIGTGSFSIGGSPIPQSPTVEADESPSRDPRSPAAPDVSSDTFQNQKQWYAVNEGTFRWTVPEGTTRTRLLLGKMAKSDPTVVYDPAISSRLLEDIDDGIWYLHVQLENQYGWGAVTHYAIRVDTVKPDSFTVKESSRSDKTNPRARFAFSATDSTSGISHYTVQIDGSEALRWQDDGTGVYETPVLAPGKHTLLARAYDEAGNFAVTSVDFVVEPIASPEITYLTEEVTTDSPLVVRGNALPHVEITAFVTRGDDEDAESIGSVKSDASGTFSIASNTTLERGAYRLWTLATDSRGATSEPSVPKAFVVKKPLFSSIGESVITVLTVAVPIVALAFGLVFISLFSMHKIRQFRKGVRKELRDVEAIVDKAFELLKEDVEDSIRMLERAKTRRHLTREEDHIIERFRQNLADAERAIQKEIHDVEKKIGDR